MNDDPNRYYFVKVVNLPYDENEETYHQRQAKLLLYNEHSVLSMLDNVDGVIRHHGLYMDVFKSPGHIDDDDEEETNCKSTQVAEQDFSFNANVDEDKCGSFIEKSTLARRVVFALDCLLPHVFCPTLETYTQKNDSKYVSMNAEFENLQEYVKRYKTIPELQALQIFYEIVCVLHDIHQQNIAHRDLRLENILYNNQSGKVVLINFGLSRYVINDSVCICDHRGSSAYISPDVLKRRPYNPKSSDCWALGIILYTMLFGKFPFYADSFADLFKKISFGVFSIPANVLIWTKSCEVQPLKTETHSIVICNETASIIKSLIVTESSKRMNIVDLKFQVKSLLQAKHKFMNKADCQRLIKRKKCLNEDLQVVPDIDLDGSKISQKMIKDTKFDSSEHNTCEYFDCLRADKSKATLFDECPNSDLFSNHLADHNYTIDKPIDESSLDKDSELTDSSLDLYFSNLYKSTTSFNNSPSPYFSLYNRFQVKCIPSVYAPRFSHSKCLLLSDSSDSIQTKKCSSKRIKTKATSSATNFSSIATDSLSFLRQQQFNMNKFNQRFSSESKSNFSILQIDGDIRPLKSHEQEILKQFDIDKEGT